MESTEEKLALRERIVERLNQVFTDRYQSLAKYMLDAQPYVNGTDGKALKTIREIADYDKAQAQRLADVIESMEGIPQVVAPYPHDIAELNYLALPYLQKVLVQKLLDQAKAYEGLLPALESSPTAHLTVSKICNDLRAQAQSLQN